MESHYFAYGSNLDLARLRGRVGAVAVRGAARLDGHRLAWNKRGRDGSGKANLLADPGASVWGVVYAVAEDAWRALDRCEAGYRRLEVEVELRSGGRTGATTYVSARLCSAPPFAWYRDLVAAGARRHGLPPQWVARLEAAAAQPDPAAGPLGDPPAGPGREG